MTFGQPIAPCGDCVDGRCTMNCSTPMKPGSIFPDRKPADPWAELVALARQIDPTLPADLSGHEIRITLSKDFQGVEVIDRRALARLGEIVRAP